MESTQSIQRYCGADKGKGRGTCQRPAGWGTPYKTGPCINHGGALPNVQKHHGRLAALEFARGQLGQELDMDPLEGLAVAVRLAYGVVDSYRHQLLDPDNTVDNLEYMKVLTDYTNICKVTVGAGVAERQIKIVERMAERITLAAEEALGTLKLDAAQRAVFAQAFGAALSRLEAPTVDSTARELAA